MKEFKKDPESLIGIGLVLGVAIGAALDNVGLGIALGLVFGAGLADHYKKLNKDEDESSKE